MADKLVAPETLDETRWYRIQANHAWYAIQACCRSCATRRLQDWVLVKDPTCELPADMLKL